MSKPVVSDTLDEVRLPNQDLGSFASLMNWSKDDMLLIGYCVMSFERITFLMIRLVSQNNSNLEKRLFDSRAGKVTKVIGETFGQESRIYLDYDALVKDRNAIIHAFGFPDLKDERWSRYYLKNMNIEAKIDKEFMEKFVERCFQFQPILDYKKMLKEMRKA